MRYIFFLFLLSCSPKSELSNPNKMIPLSGQESIPQIHVVLDARSQSWFEPDSFSFTSELPARIEFSKVKSELEAKELFSVLNGRPLDALFIGTGLPLLVWNKIDLPKNQKRKDFFFGQSSKSGVKIYPDLKELEQLIQSLCSQSFIMAPCEIRPIGVLSFVDQKPSKLAPLIISFSKNANSEVAFDHPIILNIWIDWVGFLVSHVLNGRTSAFSSPISNNIVINFENNILKAQIPSVLTRSHSSLALSLNDFLTQWSLQRISENQLKPQAVPNFSSSKNAK